MASSDTDRTALNPAFDPGDYLCTWHVPLEGDKFGDIQGLLTVQANRPPEGQIHGDLPIRWQEGPGEQRSVGFPQHVECEVLTARLSTGANAVLTDALITYWFPNQGHVSGASAVLTLDDVTREAQPAYSRIEFQVEGLDAVAGVAPLKSMSWPNMKNLRHLEGTWSAEGNPDSSQEWSDGDINLGLDYNATVRTFDPYSYRIGFSPVVRIEVPKALTIREWIDEWVQPVRRIVSICTGKVVDLTYLATRAPAGQPSARHGQVFGTGITQQPYESLQTRIRDWRTALMLKSDDVSLLTLTRAWQGLERQHHPLIETYGAMLTSHDQHPRSRFLLLVQAIEGLHGYETRQHYEKRRKRHEERRAALIETTKEHLDSDARKFLKRNLRKEPISNAEEALQAMISGLPVDLMHLLDATKLVQAVKQEEPVTTVGALRVVRNNLSHGVRGYDPEDLHTVLQILERVVRAHALRLLGCPDIVQNRALQSDR